MLCIKLEINEGKASKDNSGILLNKIKRWKSSKQDSISLYINPYPANVENRVSS
jgi:hypothetical protein